MRKPEAVARVVVQVLRGLKGDNGLRDRRVIAGPLHAVVRVSSCFSTSAELFPAQRGAAGQTCHPVAIA